MRLSLCARTYALTPSRGDDTQDASCCINVMTARLGKGELWLGRKRILWVFLISEL